MSKFRQLSEEGLTNYIRKISGDDDDAKELRKELIEATKRSSAFVAHVKKHIGFDDDKKMDVRLGKGLKFNEQQYRSATDSEESVIAQSIGECSAHLATNAEYWGGLTIAMIDAGLIQSHYLASKPNDTHNAKNKGKHRIDSALRKKQYDELPRYILRSFCGHPRLRNTAHRDYLQFCPVSRAWWRRRLAVASSSRNGIESSTIHKTLINRGIWNHLSERGVSKLTVISDANIFSGLVHFFVQSKVVSEKECRKITGYVGAQSTWRELGAFSAIEVSDLLTSRRR